MATIWDWITAQSENQGRAQGGGDLSEAQKLDERRFAHAQRQKSFTPGSPHSSLRGGISSGGGGDLLTGNNGRYSDSIMGMLELLKDAEKSSMGAYRSDDEREASSSQASRLRNLLGNRIADPGSLVRGGGGGSLGMGISRGRAGINSSALGAIDQARNKGREEMAYKLFQRRNALDLAGQENALDAQQYETARRPQMDQFKRSLILQLMRGVL